MKEVNKVLGKKGKYKNLTQEDIDRIVNQTERSYIPKRSRQSVC